MWKKHVLVLLALAFPLPLSAAPGDMDNDGDIDSGDYAVLRACMMGPDAAVLSLNCEPGKFDLDLDIDLHDAAGFQAAFTGDCPGVQSNDECACPTPVGDGAVTYDSRGATTDGPDEPAMCDHSGQTNVRSDLWYCYTASCTGAAFVSLCGSGYDTRLAVYAGCDCPSPPALACSDDDCGRDAALVQSRVELAVAEGAQYMIRVGGFGNSRGDGLLTIGCNVDSCNAAVTSCFAPSEAPGCEDPTCCASTCELDQYCCDVAWDTTCAGEAQGVCTGSFAACGTHPGACTAPQVVPGCSDVDCCNAVCFNDPFCCLGAWDVACVREASEQCPP